MSLRYSARTARCSAVQCSAVWHGIVLSRGRAQPLGHWHSSAMPDSRHLHLLATWYRSAQVCACRPHPVLFEVLRLGSITISLAHPRTRSPSPVSCLLSAPCHYHRADLGVVFHPVGGSAVVGDAGDRGLCHRVRAPHAEARQPHAHRAVLFGGDGQCASDPGASLRLGDMHARTRNKLIRTVVL